jgi:hypothetical protein
MAPKDDQGPRFEALMWETLLQLRANMPQDPEIDYLLTP